MARSTQSACLQLITLNQLTKENIGGFIILSKHHIIRLICSVSCIRPDIVSSSATVMFKGQFVILYLKYQRYRSFFRQILALVTSQIGITVNICKAFVGMWGQEDLQ